MNKIKLTLVAAALSAAGSAAAQVPAAAPAPPPPPPIIANPTYVSIPMTIDVNRPAAEVWKRVGKYCDISEWLPNAQPCRILAGVDGQVGAIRSAGQGEVMVAVTPLSYAYTQTPKVGVPYNLYHGNLEVRPLTATTSRIYYTLFYDNSMLPDDEARRKDIETRRTRFTQGVRNMKTLAEGGALPPPAR